MQSNNELVTPSNIRERLLEIAQIRGLDVESGKVRRTSARFCLGVEHGDYNGMELFGWGVDRFIWLAYKRNSLGKIRIYSDNFPEEGVVTVDLQRPTPRADVKSWSRFPNGVHAILEQAGYGCRTGFDAAIVGNIPGGGMSRSASLTLNLILTLMEVNGVTEESGMRIVDLAQMVENDYIGSPCGKLDQLMIYFARKGMGIHYKPASNRVENVPFGGDVDDFRIIAMDTGTIRPGLEKSTYKIRREECEAAQTLLSQRLNIKTIAELKDSAKKMQALQILKQEQPGFVPRLNYLLAAQERFYQSISAWEAGDIETIGANFRLDGFGLRDEYAISGPELETMCDIARKVDGVLGERMLGGGDKGASGAIIRPSAWEALQLAIQEEYPMKHPDYSERFALHRCQSVDGIITEPL